MKGMRAAQFWRIFCTAALVLNLIVLAYNVATGNGLAFVNAIAVVLCAVAIYVNTRTIHRIEARNRPRPDYSLIADMEREVYGETFEHDRAPKPAPGSVAELHAMMDDLADRGTERHRRRAQSERFDDDCRAMRALAAASRAKARTAGEHGYLPENLRWERESDRFRRRLEEGPRYPDTTKPATIDQYVAWLRGYVKNGGKITHFRDYPFKGFRYAASGPLVVESDYEYGANSREIIVARNVETRRTDQGEAFGGWAHSHLYFMHGYRTNKPGCVAVYSDPEFDAFRPETGS